MVSYSALAWQRNMIAKFPLMRDVFESDEVITVKDAHENKNHRIGDAWAALVWSLAIEPEPKNSQCLQANVGNCRIYTQSDESLSGVPAITVIKNNRTEPENGMYHTKPIYDGISTLLFPFDKQYVDTY